MQIKPNPEVLDEIKTAQKIAYAKAKLDSVVTAIEAAHLYKLASSTTRNACADGRIVARKSGRDWIMLRSDADALWGEKAKRKQERRAIVG